MNVYASLRKEMVEANEHMSKGLVEGVLEALTDKHSQVDLHLRGLKLSLGESQLALKLSGDVSLSVHMRDLTEEEKAAHVAVNVARLQP